VKIIKKI